MDIYGYLITHRIHGAAIYDGNIYMLILMGKSSRLIVVI